MDDRVLRLRLGVVVLAAAAITGFLVILFSDSPLPTSSKYTLFVLFRRAPGVTVGTPVRKNGVTIGRVTDVELTQPEGVRVTCEIQGKVTLLNSDECRISSASVLGDAVVEFVPPNEPVLTAKPILANTEIQNGITSGNPMEVLVNLESDMRSALNSMRDAGNEVQRTANSLNQMVSQGDDRIPRLMSKAERALDQFNTSMATINDLFGDPELRDSMKKSLRDLPDTLAEARTTLDNANKAFAGFTTVAQRAEKNLANLENFTQPLAERGPVMVENLDGSLANVNELLGQLVTFTDNLNNRQGSFGRLMNDPEIYDRLNRTLANAEEITFKLQPIMDDIRIFSDKIARDPRQLGVKGALDRRPTNTGLKQPVFGGIGSTVGSGAEAYCEPTTASVDDEQYYSPSPVLQR